MQQIEEPNYAQLSDQEMRVILKKYRMPRGIPQPDTFGFLAISTLARIKRSQLYYFADNKPGFDLPDVQKRRLSRLIVQLETGVLRKVKGKLLYGEPTRNMPVRMQLAFTAQGVKIQANTSPQLTAERMPDFNSVFSGDGNKLPVKFKCQF